MLLLLLFSLSPIFGVAVVVIVGVVVIGGWWLVTGGGVIGGSVFVAVYDNDDGCY